MTGLFTKGIAIDLGTANTLIYIKGRGIVLDEPSVIAISERDSSVLAVGREAKEIYGKTPDFIKTVRPIKDGVITDFEITQQMISSFILRVLKPPLLFGKRIKMVIGVPSGITDVEKRAVIEAAEKAQAREVYLIAEPMAAAIGSGLPVHEPTAQMIVDIGGGTTEAAVICSYVVSCWESIRVAGDEMDEAIAHYIRERFNLDIDIFEAERVKKAIGCATSQEEKLEIDVRGKDLSTEMPKIVRVDSEMIRESLRSPLMSIIEVIRRTLEHISSALAADIQDRGLTIAGGGSLLRGLAPFIESEIHLPVQVARDPLVAIVRGAGIVLENFSTYRRVCLG
ncbi:MAG: rod shape-determining protein [Candidatus Tectomicrobia bacterium]|uniref:Cell shape-determining protein MreB n=1 Tax=Tectimicrobiota bacterium TaxID=2528274 RepID=A0A932CNL9_UNCTE|nr:rod shape-determining protein [Candidatus Tectomicrobia bacterium]